jgi:hypothetical protein
VPMWGRGGTTSAIRTRRRNFQTAFFMPELFDNNSIEQWIAEGSHEITARALAQARAMLADEALRTSEPDRARMKGVERGASGDIATSPGATRDPGADPRERAQPGPSDRTA